MRSALYTMRALQDYTQRRNDGETGENVKEYRHLL